MWLVSSVSLTPFEQCTANVAGDELNWVEISFERNVYVRPLFLSLIHTHIHTLFLYSASSNETGWNASLPPPQQDKLCVCGKNEISNIIVSNTELDQQLYHHSGWLWYSLSLSLSLSLSHLNHTIPPVSLSHDDLPVPICTILVQWMPTRFVFFFFCKRRMVIKYTRT